MDVCVGKIDCLLLLLASLRVKLVI